MQEFMQQHKDDVNGSLSGWDRLCFRGTIRWLANVHGMLSFMHQHRILLKDFKDWAQALTERISQSSDLLARSLGLCIEYLNKPSINKEACARQIALDKGIKQGPICMFSVVEPCVSPRVSGSRSDKKLHLEMLPGRCKWLYLYFDDPQLGFGHVRLQTHLPFTIKGCLNGRHWLERSLLAEGIDYVKDGNCFRWLQDPARAQQLLDDQLKTNWPQLLDGFVDRYFPVMRQFFEQDPLRYYWSADESEWATDIMFHDTRRLDRLFPLLVRHGMLLSDSANVMRYLGRITAEGSLPAHLTADVRSDQRKRFEGVCVKHRLGANSVKVYNKSGNVLRTETTINKPRDFKVFRQPNDDAQRSAAWLPMRKGVADLHRRAHVSQRSNERYLDALSACENEQTLLECIGQNCKRIVRAEARPVRALNPYNETDFHALKFLTQGEWNISGFRNRDLASWLDPHADELAPDLRRKLTARVSRLLSILKAHGLIQKVPKTHRYQLTTKGRQVATLVIAASVVQTEQLMKMAA